MTTVKGVGGWQRFEVCVYSTAKRIGSLQSFGVRFDHYKASKRPADIWRVLFDHAKRVGGLQKFGVCVLTIAKCVACLQNFGESFDHRRACRRLA